jgi:hypothetical protein
MTDRRASEEARLFRKAGLLERPLSPAAAETLPEL